MLTVDVTTRILHFPLSCVSSTKRSLHQCWIILSFEANAKALKQYAVDTSDVKHEEGTFHNTTISPIRSKPLCFQFNRLALHLKLVACVYRRLEMIACNFSSKGGLIEPCY